MRISLADSQANGFKRWSDAQRPPAPQPARDDAAAEKEPGDPSLTGSVPAGK